MYANINSHAQCNRVAGLQEYFRMVNNPPVYIAAIGTGCSLSTEPIAELIHFWNLPLVRVIPTSISLQPYIGVGMNVKMVGLNGFRPI